MNLNNIFNRRDFLRFSFFTLTNLLIAKAILGSQPDKKKEKIIVIGAGFAGLAAAVELATADYQVTVLEARTRLGGRVWSNNSTGHIIDVGGSWIHGMKNNPITDLAKKYNAAYEITNEDAYAVFNESGKQLTHEEAEYIEKNYKKIFSEVVKIGRKSDKDKSIGECIRKAMKDMQLSEKEKKELEWAIATTEVEAASDMNGLSVYYTNTDDSFGGDDALFPKGFIQILNGLATGLDIKVGQIVDKIEYSPNEVKIHASGTVFQAAKVIITLPLGVLKESYQAPAPLILDCTNCHSHGGSVMPGVHQVTFNPALPERKQKAIKRLGMGHFNKIVMLFPKMFWPEDAHFIGYITEKKPEFPEFISMYPSLKSPILISFVAGSFARDMELQTNDYIITRLMDSLRSVFGKNIPSPEKFMITRWSHDHFAGGAYSHIPPGATDEDYDIMAEPVKNVLFFAGEATSKQYPATIHGAFLSGVREANRIIEMTK